MAVVVQRMVDPPAAGVLVTANPITGCRTEVGRRRRLRPRRRFVGHPGMVDIGGRMYMDITAFDGLVQGDHPGRGDGQELVSERDDLAQAVV